MLEIQATEQNVTFPVAFTEWCIACGSRVTGTGGNPTTLGASAAFSDPVTLTYATVFSIETQEDYRVAVGKQQWGLTPEAILPTVDFPLAFTAIPAVVGTPIKDYATSENYFGNNSIENVTNTSFVARQTNTNGGTKAGAIRFIAIGY